MGSLIRHLEDESNMVRSESAFALGEIGDKKAIEPLVVIVRSSKAPGTVEAAREALEKLK